MSFLSDLQRLLDAGYHPVRGGTDAPPGALDHAISSPDPAAAEPGSPPSEPPAEPDSTPPAEPAPADPTELNPAQQEYVREQIAQLIAQRDQQWLSRLEQQQQNQPQNDPPETPAAPPAEDFDAQITALYTDDDVGRSIRRSIDQHVALILKQRGLEGERLSAEDVERIAGEQAGKVRDQIDSQIAVRQEVQDLVTRNMIGQDDARTVEQEYARALNAPGMQEAASNPGNAAWILKGVVYDLIKGNKIKPHSTRSRPTNPLQPGGNGSPPADPEAAAQAAKFDPTKSPFKSVRNLSPDKAKAAEALSEHNWSRANG